MSTSNDQNSLANLFLKPKVSSLWYNQKEVKLDGYTFETCRFDNCVLIVTTANFELINCFIGDNTSFRFGTEISNPIRLFNHGDDRVYNKNPFFAPIRNADGTVTIKAHDND